MIAMMIRRSSAGWNPGRNLRRRRKIQTLRVNEQPGFQPALE